MAVLDPSTLSATVYTQPSVYRLSLSMSLKNLVVVILVHRCLQVSSLASASFLFLSSLSFNFSARCLGVPPVGPHHWSFAPFTEAQLVIASVCNILKEISRCRSSTNQMG